MAFECKCTRLQVVKGSDRIKIMRDKIKMVSSANTGHYYTTDKNKRTMSDKLEMKKYDPVVRKHVIYKEAKIK